MNLVEYEYLWGKEQNNWVLVNTSYGYCIVNKREQSALLVSDDDLEDALIEKMLVAGNKTYENINDAYADV